jgi:hypothetical protein
MAPNIGACSVSDSLHGIIMAPNIGACSVSDSLHGIIMAPRIVRWLLDFWKNLCFPELHIGPNILIGRDISVGIATRYGLDGPGIDSRWGRDFSRPSRPALGPTQPPVQWVPGVSRSYSGRGVVLTTHPLLAPRLRNGRAIPLSNL